MTVPVAAKQALAQSAIFSQIDRIRGNLKNTRPLTLEI